MQNTRVYERARVKCFKLGRLLSGAPAAPDFFLFLDVPNAAAQVSAGAHYTSHSIPKPNKNQTKTKTKPKPGPRSMSLAVAATLCHAAAPANLPPNLA